MSLKSTMWRISNETVRRKKSCRGIPNDNNCIYCHHIPVLIISVVLFNMWLERRGKWNMYKTIFAQPSMQPKQSRSDINIINAKWVCHWHQFHCKNVIGLLINILKNHSWNKQKSLPISHMIIIENINCESLTARLENWIFNKNLFAAINCRAFGLWAIRRNIKKKFPSRHPRNTWPVYNLLTFYNFSLWSQMDKNVKWICIFFRFFPHDLLSLIAGIVGGISRAIFFL